jgi:hypothetical protein
LARNGALGDAAQLLSPVASGCGPIKGISALTEALFKLFRDFVLFCRGLEFFSPLYLQFHDLHDATLGVIPLILLRANAGINPIGLAHNAAVTVNARGTSN